METTLSFVIETEGFNIVFLPHPPIKLGEGALSEYEQADVLLIPGKYHEIVNQLASPIVIPLDEGAQLAEKMGAELTEARSSLTIKTRSDLPEETELVNMDNQ